MAVVTPENMSSSEHPELSAAAPLTGLTSAEVERRIADGQVNVNTELKTKSFKELVIENLCTLFNLINLVLAILVLLTGSFKNLSFLAIVLLNTGIGVVQSWRSKRMVDKLTLLASKRALVVRDGREVEVDLDQIVIDDLVRLGRGDQIPADAVVVSGEAQVNESLLTGESDLIRKRPGSELMSGSFVDSGLIHAQVIHVGADNYVAKINNEAKYVKKVNSEIMNALNAIVRFASVIMLPLGIALFYSSVHVAYEHAGVGMSFFAWALSGTEAWGSVSAAILSTVAALLGMIPQGLVLLTSSVLAIATIRLARRNVLAQQLYCIETLARVDVLCLDKTGTITSGRMEVAGLYLLDADGSEREAEFGGEGAAELDFALSNIARATSADANETCQAVLSYYAGKDAVVAEPLSIVPFSSAKKWSGAVFEQGSYIMGAAQFVLDDDSFKTYESSVNKIADTCRVLLVGRVSGFTDEGEMIGSVEPLGLVAIRDEIRTSAKDTIGYFREQGVTLNVISGDDPRTVSSIARVVGIPGADSYVDATRLDTPAKIDAAVDKYHVFGRVTPQQKRELVCALKKRGHTVAMTGDGVNDVLALKEADCSVAMAAGSDAARNVAEIVLISNDFASMPAVVAEGRRSINNLQRSASLFLTKTLFSMALAALCIFFPPYPFQPITMTLINFFCIGFPSFVLALEANNSRIQGRFLSNVLRRACPASVSVLLSACLCMFIASTLSYSDIELSTMCLISTCAVGSSLIWRISFPFSPLRLAVFIFVVAGIFVGVIFFPDFFSIAQLSLFQFIVAILVALIGCACFFILADLFDRMPERTSRRATGFGRGVRMSVSKGKRSLSSTGTSFQRMASRLGRRVEKRKRERELDRARASAARAIEGTSVSGHGGKRISRSSGGIRVSMPSHKGKKRGSSR